MTEPQPDPGQPVSAGANRHAAGHPRMDPATVLRSRAYLSALVLAAILGIPISAVAYGFLALVTKIQDDHLPRPAGRPLHGRDAGLVAGAVARPVWPADRGDDPLPAGQRWPLTRHGVPDRRYAGRPGAARDHPGRAGHA